MNFVNIVWSLSIWACLCLATLYLVIWFQQTDLVAYLLFSVIATSVAAIAVCEWLLMLAQSPEEYGRLIWWAHIPVFFAALSIVGFVRLYFNAGRWWLGLAACGLRLLDLVMNFFSTPNLDYKEIVGLSHLTIFGGETVSVAKGLENPWNKVSELSSLFLLLFVADASVTLWRWGNPGERRRAVVVGGAIIFFILIAAGYSALIEAGLVSSPYLISLPFLAIVLAMGFELSSDVVRAARLARQLRATEAASRERRASAARIAPWTSST